MQNENAMYMKQKTTIKHSTERDYINQTKTLLPSPLGLELQPHPDAPAATCDGVRA